MMKPQMLRRDRFAQTSLRGVAAILVSVVMLAPLSMMAAVADAAKVQIVEPIGLEWVNELIHERVELKQGAVFLPQASVLDSAGVPTVSQVSDVERYDDGSIRSMNVWFRVDLAADATDSYTIRAGEPGHADNKINVDVQEDGDTLTITTDAPTPIGIRLPAGSKTMPFPEPFADKLAPIQGLLLPSGAWVGKPHIAAPFKIKSYETRILNQGPLFTEAQVSYLLDTGWWRFNVRVVAGQPLIEVSEALDTGDTGIKAKQADLFFELVLNSDGFQPTQGWYSDNIAQPRLHDLGEKLAPPAFEKFQNSARFSGVSISGYTLNFDETRDDYHLIGWPSGQSNVGVMARFLKPGGDAIGFTSLHVDGWRNPLSIRFQSRGDGSLVARFPIQDYEQDWSTEGFGEQSPNYTGQTLYSPPSETRRSYGIMLSAAEDEAAHRLESLLGQVTHVADQPLDEMRQRVFEWPDPMADGGWAQESSGAGKEALQIMRDRVEAIHAAGNHVFWSMGQHFQYNRAVYPKVAAVIDDPAQLSAADRAELRRLCVFIAYRQNSPYQRPDGTGFHLMNPNMTIMAIEARTKSASLIKDHPMFSTWGGEAAHLLRAFFTRYTFESGAPFENPHYTLSVTLDWAMQANELLIENGIGDAMDTPLFRDCMRFLMQAWLTPADPRFHGHRVILPLGNTSYQSVPPEFAQRYVTYFKDRDPQLAAELQWFCNQTLPEDKQVHLVKEQVPELASHWYKDYGVVFRHGAGTPNESFMSLLAGKTVGHYENETDQMTYSIYAKGYPIHLHFGNGYFPIFSRPWLRNRISYDMKVEAPERDPVDIVASSLTDASDYAHATRQTNQLMTYEGEYPDLNEKDQKWTPEESKRFTAFIASWDAPENFIPLTVWHRQMMMLKDPDPAGPNYFVLRDTFDGRPTKPTDLNLWFLANKMEKQGDVFHFDGQLGVDMDVFVATPEPGAFEPHTDRYGHVQQPYRLLVGQDASQYPDGKVSEDQLLLRVRQPAGKGYLTVLYPRLKSGDPAATFERVSDSAVRVKTPTSTDLIVLDSSLQTVTDGGVTFKGRSGAVRRYTDGRVVVINHEAAATVTIDGWTLESSGAFVAEQLDGKWRVTDHADGLEVKIDKE